MGLEEELESLDKEEAVVDTLIDNGLLTTSLVEEGLTIELAEVVFKNKGPLLVAAGRDVCPGATPAPPPLLFPFVCVIVVDEVIVAV